MLKSILDIIPKSYRRRGLWVAATVFLRAILNFVGVAMFVPILMLTLKPEGGSRVLDRFSELFAVDDHSEMVLAVCGIVLVVIVVKSLIVMLLHSYEQNFIFSFYKQVSQKLFLSYYERGLGYIKQHNSSHIARNINVAGLMFATGVLRPIAAILGEALLLVMVFIALAIYAPIAALLTLVVFLPVMSIFWLAVRRRLHDIGVRENDVQRHKSRVVSETFRGYADIEIGGAKELMFSVFNDDVDKVSDLRKRHATLSQLPQILVEIGVVVGMILVVLLSLDNGEDMALMFGIFAVVAIRLIPSVRNILSQWSLIKYNRYTIDILLDANVGEERVVAEESCEGMRLQNSIEFDGVSFKFEDADRPTIDTLSFTIARGEHIGICGASGVGKTTLFNLLLGLYRPTSGVIRIDGEELTARHIRKWQNSIGYVSQSLFIADSTIAENIALGVAKDKIDYDLVNEAVRLANLHSFIESLPNGLDTRIGEAGSRLSGGQRQRIGIARALYKGCDILLFDEATSSLDSVAEESINESLLALKRSNENLTIVLIAHRQSTLDNCNRIITLE
ncbi:MAG: ABC transporter ATP-binding protein [Alistipes sp.]|nr:ABC transporter ATP-binding protein [Alistipes sp.]